jgi:hypothetical protein
MTHNRLMRVSMGKYLSIGPNRGRCPLPPVQIRPGGFTHRSQVVPIERNWTSRCPTSVGVGVMETLFPGLRYNA